MRKTLVPAMLLAAVLAAPATAAAPTSGLYGVVRRGPIRPVCSVGEPCSAPVRTTLVFTRAGARPTRVSSRADGHYRVALARGRYTVSATYRGIGRGPEPRTVTVPARRFARVDLTIDTGIR